MSNHLTLTGNIVRDPELRYTAGGSPRAVMPVATSRRFQAKGADQPTEVTSFFTVIVWGQLAEHVSESLRKGDRVTISGRVEQRSWVDEAQQRHSSFDIVADDVAASLRFRTARIDRTARAVTEAPDGTEETSGATQAAGGSDSSSFDTGPSSFAAVGQPADPQADQPGFEPFDEFAAAS